MMNRMKEIAELFGVELEEEFKINQSHGVYKFTEAGLMFKPYNEWELSFKFFNEVINSDIIKSVLNRQEKEYLEGVLRPFKDSVECITKITYYSYDFSSGEDEESEHVSISIKDKFDIFLPPFEPGSMYKGMNLNKEYTLKELGLFNED